jgi:hypothetical protein
MDEKSTDLGSETHVSQQAIVPLHSVERSLSISGANKDDTEKSIATPDTSLDDKPDYQYPTGLTKALIIGPVTMTYFLFFLDLAVVSTATPAITSQFNSLVDVGWYSLLEFPTNIVLLTAAC